MRWLRDKLEDSEFEKMTLLLGKSPASLGNTSAVHFLMSRACAFEGCWWLCAVGMEGGGVAIFHFHFRLQPLCF